MPSSRLAEHFDGLPRQEHAVRLGMWVFLASELVLFGGLFALYAGYRAMYPGEFAAAIAHNTIVHGTVNTYVLKDIDGREVVRAMYVLDPTRVTPMVAEYGSIFYEFKRDENSGISAETVIVPADAINNDM